MEADERLRWLEARISSSLRPRGEELRNFFADEENRQDMHTLHAQHMYTHTVHSIVVATDSVISEVL